ncbi:plexin-A4-like isoform X2 [Dysidea avara]|uniref:plexin-A4-like isoform X2 n=1 Tax=Dysidea avara TaxID=196820 RepID=UPI0033322792
MDTRKDSYSVTINSSTLTLRESFSITVGPVTSLAVSPDQNVIYALTPNKLVSFPGEQCGEHTSCDQCLDQVDPVCGWCTLDNKCSTNDSCSSTLWISSNGVSSSDQCPTGSIIDNIISTEQLPYNVTVDAINLPMREVDCVFTVGTMSIMGPAQLVDNSVICPITTYTSSLFTSGDTIMMSVSLRARGSGQSFLNVTGHITVFDCMSHTTCSSCLNSQHECSWCPYDVQCTATGPVSCDSGLEGNITTTDSCPQLTPNDNYTLNMNTAQQLVINGKNLFEDGGNYYCVVSYRGEEISVVGSWDPVQMTITCEQRNFFFSSAAGQSRVTADLKVLWKTVNNYTIDEAVASVQVTLYQCHLLGPDCTSCLAQDETHFDCVYCPETNCVFRSSCSVNPYDSCPAPLINMFSPVSGPIEGGTVVTIEGSNWGMNFQDVMKIMIGNVNCIPNEDSYMVGRRVNCVTDVVNEPQSSSITIVTNNGVHDSSDHFYYKRVTVNQVYPNRGPMSGGTQINITGSNFNIGNIQNVLVGDKMCSMINITSEWITCETERGDVGVVDITIMVDNFNGTTSYTFVDDPTFTSISPVFSFTSGGTKFLVRGERLDIVQSPQLLLTIASSSGKRQADMEFTGPCNALNDTALSCEAPTLPPHDNSTTQLVRLGLVMDGVTQLRSLNETIQVYRDPVFSPLTEDNSSLVFELREYDVITINGSYFRFTTDQLMVKIGSEGSCRVLSSITLTSVECIPNEADYPVNQDIPLMVHLGNQVTTLGTIRFREEEEEENSIVVIIIAVVVSAIVLVVLMLVFITILYCFWRNSRRKDQKLDELQMTLSKLETNVAHECKEAFTQLLTDLDEYTGDLTNVSLPYFDFQTYMVKTVLSGLEDTLLSSKFRNNQLPQLSKRLEEFHHLMMDKRFLLILIKTMEEQRDFSIREKCQMGNLLTVILHTRLDYLTQIMKLSMSELIRKSVAKDNYRVLLRRTDSVAERILSNWLALCLHQHILDQVGQPLYMLFRAIKGQLEKGPVDVVTGDARYSLSEQRIIRQQMPEVPEIIALVIAEENNIRANVRLLQCDTISQAKEKIFDHIYKSQPVSTRPYTFFNSDLHFMMANGRVTVLRDFDYTTIEDGEWKKVNTLCHYEVHKELNPCLKLVKKNRYTSEVTEFPATLVTTPNTQIKPHSNEEGQKYWHLFKHVDVDDPVMSPLLSKKLVTEVFFPRILYTKKVLQKFVDDLFKALFSIDHEPSTPCIHSRQFIFPNGNIPPPQTYTRGADTIPVAIKYLFDFLDHEAINTGVADPDVVHVWKNNSLSLRFWVNLIKNPEFVFDINKSLTMDSCLSIVAQAFIDGCSLSDVKLTKDSPTGKLLYNKDVMGYKHEVKRYYDEIRRLPQVSEETMITYLKGLSNYQVHQLIHDNYPFSLHSALYQLLKLTGRHSHKILENLREKGLDTPAMAYETILHEILTQV